eukprot:scaffold25847_cov140-Isochrysis_galbana.AAC.1
MARSGRAPALSSVGSVQCMRPVRWLGAVYKSTVPQKTHNTIISRCAACSCGCAAAVPLPLQRPGCGWHLLNLAFALATREQHGDADFYDFCRRARPPRAMARWTSSAFLRRRPSGNAQREDGRGGIGVMWT